MLAFKNSYSLLKYFSWLFKWISAFDILPFLKNRRYRSKQTQSGPCRPPAQPLMKNDWKPEKRVVVTLWTRSERATRFSNVVKPVTNGTASFFRCWMMGRSLPPSVRPVSAVRVGRILWQVCKTLLSFIERGTFLCLCLSPFIDLKTSTLTFRNSCSAD